MKYHLELGFKVRDFGDADALDEHVDCVLEFLDQDDRVIDPDYVAALTAGKVEFSLTVDAEAEPEALETALGALRAAIHGAEGCTPGWEALFEKGKTVIREAELVEA